MLKSKFHPVKIACIFFTLLLLSGCGSQETSQNETTDRQMPAFSAKDLEGNTITEEIFSEKDLTVVNIWATYCPPCIEEMPELGEWAEEMPENVQIIGLVCDIAGEEDTEHHDLAVEIAEQAGTSFPHIVANEDFDDILGMVVGVPTTFFVDKEGNMVGKWIVGADVEGYKAFVEEYFSEQ